MERHLKERIVGATVIVALGIIVIPWLLDGPAQSSRPVEQALELPGAGPPGRSYTIPLDPAGGPPVALDTGSGADPVPPRPDSGAVQRQPTETVTSVAPAQTARRAEQPAQPAPRPAPQVAPPAAGGEPAWTVQVGSFSQAENAEGLRRRLAEQGFDAFVSRVATDAGTMHRVRVGPVPEREAADRLLARLTATGHQGRVVRAED